MPSTSRISTPSESQRSLARSASNWKSPRCPKRIALFAEEMGLTESCRSKLLRAIFEITEQITFYTCDEKEVHAWLLKRGSSALEAAGTIHTDLARGFIRAEIMSTDDLLRLGSEKEVKAAGLFRTEGKESLIRDGDEIVIRFSV